MHDLPEIASRFRTRIPLYHVDAFTHEVFGGNPAAVCPLPRWLPEETLQAIAIENALPEIAFLSGVVSASRSAGSCPTGRRSTCAATPPWPAPTCCPGT